MFFKHTEGVAFAQLRYGPGEGPVYLEDLQCTGRENSLLECSHPPVGSVSRFCGTHRNDISVQCLTGIYYTYYYMALYIAIDFTIQWNVLIMR